MIKLGVNKKNSNIHEILCTDFWEEDWRFIIMEPN